MSLPLKEHTVFVDLSDPITNQGLSIHDFKTTLESLSDGYSYKIPRRKPRSYRLDVRLDWNEDVALNGFEPASAPIYFDVDGDRTVHVGALLTDKTSSNQDGWIEGVITYGGTVSGTHRLYVRVTTTNYDPLVENDVTLFGTTLDQSYHYILQDVPPGGPYYAFAYWDVNDNGTYDNDPRGISNDVFMVSQGLPTVGINIQL